MGKRELDILKSFKKPAKSFNNKLLNAELVQMGKEVERSSRLAVYNSKHKNRG